MSDLHHSSLQIAPKDTKEITKEVASHLDNDADRFEAPPSNEGYWMDPSVQKPVEQSKAVPRRRRPSGNDHVKHRRTRNGCYTCRGRRVKCDEIRPICQRCAKGKRECTYPDPRENLKASGGSKRDHGSENIGDSHSSMDEDDPAEPVASGPGLQKKSEPQKTDPSPKNSESMVKPTRRHPSSQAEHPQPSIEQVKLERSLSPSTDASSISASMGIEQREKFSSVSTDTSQEDKMLSHLPHDLHFYMTYHKTQLTFHHYHFKHDANHFLHHILVEQALRYDPLLYAVVGFAAFQSTIKRTNGKIQDFLGYYNTSVSLLRKSLRNQQTHTDATMLTILQLATFEDYMGDWVSLLGHQKAAHGMLLELYSSQSIMETELRRKILAWYLRFDVMGGLMAGYSTFLSREWFLATEDYYFQQSLIYPSSIDYKIEAAIANHRVLAGDLSLLYAQLPRGDITIDEFARASDDYSEQIDKWRDSLDPVFRDDSYLVKSFEGRKQDEDDIVNPYLPGGLYQGALFTFNFMMMDWHALKLMHKHKTAVLLGRRPPPEIRELALQICRLFEAIEYWPGSPPGAVLKAQGSLGLAIVFLPKDEKHVMWCRRKLAKVESLGHIYPVSLRHRMADEWGVPDVHDWWLPNEDACPPIVRSVQAFMIDRLPLPQVEEGESRSEDQRNINGVFSKLSLRADSEPGEGKVGAVGTATSNVPPLKRNLEQYGTG